MRARSDSKGWREPLRLVHRLGCNFVHAGEEESQPAFPVARLPHFGEHLVVVLPVALEKQAQVEQRLAQQPLVMQQQGNEQASNAAVAVQKGVDGFELHMGQRDPDEHGACSGRAESAPMRPCNLRRPAAAGAQSARCRGACRQSSFGCGETRRGACCCRACGPTALRAFRRAGDCKAGSRRAGAAGRASSAPPASEVSRTSPKPGAGAGLAQQQVGERGLRPLDLGGEHGFAGGYSGRRRAADRAAARQWRPAGPAPPAPALAGAAGANRRSGAARGAAAGARRPALPRRPTAVLSQAPVIPRFTGFLLILLWGAEWILDNT